MTSPVRKRVHPEVSDFTFRYVDGEGNAQGLSRKKGRLGSDALVLDDEPVPYEQIAETVTRGSRLVLAVPGFRRIGELGQHVLDGSVIALEPGKPSASELERAIDRRCARIEAQRRRAELVAAGKEDLLRIEECPACGAKVDLSGYEPTVYSYCSYCESVFSRDIARVTDGDRYRVCDECGMFDRIQQYPEFYFYFAVFFYGFSYRQRFLCDGCAHALFQKALLLNLLFLVGVPTALWVKIKSLSGRDPDFALLTRANAHARAGRCREAAVDYAAVLQKQPNHPGVLMSQALGYLIAGDQRQAASVLKRSLKACNHYAPALRLLPE